MPDVSANTMSSSPLQASLSSTSPSPAPARHAGGKRLAAVLLAAAVSALVVAADQLIDSYAQGDLFLMWLVSWAVGFATLALLADSTRKLGARLASAWAHGVQRYRQRQGDAYLRALAARNPHIAAELDAAITRGVPSQAQREEAFARHWVARHPAGTFNAAYQGPRGGFRTAPLTGLPTHLQYLPG